MTASCQIDYHRIFVISPTPRALLTPDLVIVDANDEFLDTVGRTLSDVIGMYVFDAFPKMPRDASGPRVTALEAAVVSKECETMQLTRYDFEDPGRPGVFEERYWGSVVTPLRGPDGKLEMLELSAREVTSVVQQVRSTQSQLG